MAIRTHVLLLVCAACLGACAVGPDYHRPKLEVPSAYRVTTGEGAALIDATWWQRFQDPTLDDLIREALINNPDVRIAAARVEEYGGPASKARVAHCSRKSATVQTPPVSARRHSDRRRSPRGVSPVASVVTAAANASWGNRPVG